LQKQRDLKLLFTTVQQFNYP